MKKEKGKYYEPEFKLRLAKDYLETDKTLEEVAQENGISSKTLNNWTVKYREEGEGAFLKGVRVSRKTGTDSFFGGRDIPPPVKASPSPVCLRRPVSVGKIPEARG